MNKSTICITEKAGAKLISKWFKDNYKGKYLEHICLRDIERGLFHEYIHKKIYSLFKIKSKIFIIFKKFDDKDFGYKMRCYGIYNYNKRIDKSFPRVLLVEFMHFLFDIIHDFFRNIFFSHIIYRIKAFFYKVSIPNELIYE